MTRNVYHLQCLTANVIRRTSATRQHPTRTVSTISTGRVCASVSPVTCSPMTDCPATRFRPRPQPRPQPQPPPQPLPPNCPKLAPPPPNPVFTGSPTDPVIN